LGPRTAMLNLLARILLLMAGSITSFFIADDALNYKIIQMAIAVLLFTLLILIAAFWHNIQAFFKKMFQKK
jgi:hypothetical protein